jgi:hypothetical protein
VKEELKLPCNQVLPCIEAAFGVGLDKIEI